MAPVNSFARHCFAAADPDQALSDAEDPELSFIDKIVAQGGPDDPARPDNDDGPSEPDDEGPLDDEDDGIPKGQAALQRRQPARDHGVPQPPTPEHPNPAPDSPEPEPNEEESTHDTSRREHHPARADPMRR